MEQFESNLVKFAEFVLQRFGPDKLKFIEFPDLRDKVPQLMQPGVFAIHCFATCRTYITHSTNIMFRMEADYYQLMEKRFEEPELLVEDYNKYGLDCFMFIIFEYGPEWAPHKKRRNEVKRLQESWPYELYL